MKNPNDRDREENKWTVGGMPVSRVLMRICGIASTKHSCSVSDSGRFACRSCRAASRDTRGFNGNRAHRVHRAVHQTRHAGVNTLPLSIGSPRGAQRAVWEITGDCIPTSPDNAIRVTSRGRKNATRNVAIARLDAKNDRFDRLEGKHLKRFHFQATYRKSIPEEESCSIGYWNSFYYSYDGDEDLWTANRTLFASPMLMVKLFYRKITISCSFKLFILYWKFFKR